MKRLTEVDETGDSIFRSTHVFYRDALKPGPQLDRLTTAFLFYLNKVLDDYAAKPLEDVRLYTWSLTMLGTASTNAMMGPSLLRDNPDLLQSVWLVENGFFLFVNRIPRIFARKYYQARDRVNAAFTEYFSDEKNREGGMPVIWEREVRLRSKGLTTRDVAAYSYSAYAVSYLSLCFETTTLIPSFQAYVISTHPLDISVSLTHLCSLLNNANPTAYWLLYHIFTSKDSLAKLRAEVAPIFTHGNTINTLEQVNYVITSCPLLRAFYDETLRLHSSSASNRRVVEEVSIGGSTLKIGHNVMVPSYIQHHMPEFFGQDMYEFAPERFIEPVLAKGTPADPKMVRAFGGGVSLCPGRFFASNEVLSYAASVLWRFDLNVKGKGNVNFVPRKM
jgi:hypothetical protein